MSQASEAFGDSFAGLIAFVSVASAAFRAFVDGLVSMGLPFLQAQNRARDRQELLRLHFRPHWTPHFLILSPWISHWHGVLEEPRAPLPWVFLHLHS